jgi:alkaline phosphatase D
MMDKLWSKSVRSVRNGAAAALFFLLSAQLAVAEMVFTGIAAGDMTDHSVVLWTRTADRDGLDGHPLSAQLSVQISADVSFLHSMIAHICTTDANHAGTVKVDIGGLRANQRYYYRFRSADGELSPIGRFTTAPMPGQKAEVKFAFSGDADGRFRPYPLIAEFAKLDLDYFIFLGDTIYETASKGSPAAADPFRDPATALVDYRRKYLENLLPVATGGQAGLQDMFASQGNYTLLDNHELGNRQFQSGGAPVGSPPGEGVDAGSPANDANRSGTYMNETAGYRALMRAYDEFEPVRRQFVATSEDPRSGGTQKLYFSQRWGANCIFINVDDRSYRDIRLAKPDGKDDTGPRADDPGRTILGAVQFAWLERTLLNAERQNVVWKIVAISSPIDQIGNDGGKSWVGGYRAERNRLLKFIADNRIRHVVFLTTDDHQNRFNQLRYADPKRPGRTILVPGAFTIVAGPLGAGGPDQITTHDFPAIKSITDTLVAKQLAQGLEPIGLDAKFPGLTNVFREGDGDADRLRQPVDFYSPDTFNYVVLDISRDGRTLSVDTWGIPSYMENTFPELAAAGAPRHILGFQIVGQPGK